MTLTPEAWERLQSWGSEFTCYSAAVATWLAAAGRDWGRTVNAGLSLTITEEPGGLFGFAYFPAGRRAELGLARAGSDEAGDAVDGALAELERSGRVIVAGDGFRLPWHVAHGRAHAPHWYVLTDGPGGLEVADPFACRNELGSQKPDRRPIERAELPGLLRALPGDSPVYRLRERLALGDETAAGTEFGFQWLVRAEVETWQEPPGARGPAAVERLARHFRERGQDPGAYAQIDDIWSVARHRAFHARSAAELGDRDDLTEWVQAHAAPIAKRWGHIAPLLFQAKLALGAGRAASPSVPDTLEELARREREAAQAFPTGLDPSSI